MFGFSPRKDRRGGGPVHRFRPLTTRLGQTAMDLLFPPRCAYCDADLPGEHDHLLLCEKCRASLGPETWPGCPRCGALATGTGPPPQTCPACRGFQLEFDTVLPLGAYDGVLRQAIVKTKRLAHEPLSVALGRLLAHRRGTELAALGLDLIVPVPMHWWRRLCRGTNSPEILAQCLSRRLGVPVRRLLVRCRNTLPQKDLDPRERFRNVRGAFRLRRSGAARLEGSHVLLVDDILTTGATCSEASRVMKQAGAKTVAVATVAKVQVSLKKGAKPPA
jgi:ComF family protein